MTEATQLTTDEALDLALEWLDHLKPGAALQGTFRELQMAIRQIDAARSARRRPGGDD